MLVGLVMLAIAALFGVVWWRTRKKEVAVWRLGYAAVVIGTLGLAIVVVNLSR